MHGHNANVKRELKAHVQSPKASNSRHTQYAKQTKQIRHPEVPALQDRTLLKKLYIDSPLYPTFGVATQIEDVHNESLLPALDGHDQSDVAVSYRTVSALSGLDEHTSDTPTATATATAATNVGSLASLWQPLDLQKLLSSISYPTAIPSSPHAEVGPFTSATPPSLTIDLATPTTSMTVDIPVENFNNKTIHMLTLTAVDAYGTVVGGSLLDSLAPGHKKLIELRLHDIVLKRSNGPATKRDLAEALSGMKVYARSASAARPQVFLLTRKSGRLGPYMYVTLAVILGILMLLGFLFVLRARRYKVNAAQRPSQDLQLQLLS